MLKPVRMAGHVIRKRINVGSKSDHEAVVLVCAQGEFKLRRRGGPPSSTKRSIRWWASASAPAASSRRASSSSTST